MGAGLWAAQMPFASCEGRWPINQRCGASTFNHGTHKMSTKVNPMKELRERQKAERKQARLEAKLLNLLPVEPKTFGVTNVGRNAGGGCYGHASYDQGFRNEYSFAQALEIARQFFPFVVLGEHWRDGCVSTQPGEINANAKRAGAVLDGTSFIQLRLNAGRGYDSHALELWAKIEGQLFAVSIRFRPDFRWLPETKFTYNQDGECCTNFVKPKALGEDSRLKWWSPPGSYHIAYFWADVHNFEAWASHELAEGRGVK